MELDQTQDLPGSGRQTSTSLPTQSLMISKYLFSSAPLEQRPTVFCVTCLHLTFPNRKQREKFSLHYESTTNRHERQNTFISFLSFSKKGYRILAEYDAALRKLATHCNFGAYLTEALRYRFVAGLRSKVMQRRLLAESYLTLKRAMELAQGMEAAL